MENIVDFSFANSEQIEMALCEQLENIRLSRNLTQTQLADESGVSIGTIRRLEAGKGVSLNTFIRILIALGLQQNLKILLPDTSIRPIERVRNSGAERKRARPVRPDAKKSTWTWGTKK
jgi:transcriptional regulator with XRE-family HTH domain